jgi:phosphoribosylanthranilate isomerase
MTTTKPPLLKVCGMQDPENLREVVQLHPNLVGYIFWEGSKRFVGHNPDPALFVVPEGTRKVGVFVNASLQEVKETVARYSLDLVQLHGEESPAYCMELQESWIEVIKVFGVDDAFDFNLLEPYLDTCSYFLFDTKVPERGGSGKTFDWSLLERYPFKKPYFLSGGIDINNVSLIFNKLPRALFAIDVNSRFETAPGYKNIDLLRDLTTRYFSPNSKNI